MVNTRSENKQSAPGWPECPGSWKPKWSPAHSPERENGANGQSIEDLAKMNAIL